MQLWCPSKLRSARLGLLVVALLGASVLPCRAIPRGDFHYDVFRLGQSIGAETAHITDGVGDSVWIASDVEYHAPGDTSGTPNPDYVKSKPSLAINGRTGQPLRYHYVALNQGVVEEANVVTSGNQIAEEGQSVRLGSETDVTPHSVVDDFTPATGLILDNLMVGGLYGVLARYDFAAGGRQLFGAFVPSIGQTVPTVVIDRGDVALRTANGLFTTRLVFVRFGVHAINVWVDDSLRVARATWPFMGVDARLRDFSGRPWTDPQGPLSMEGRNVSFTSEGASYGGVIEQPAGRGGTRPAILVVPGFGSRTRDGSVKGSPLQPNAYARLSQVLVRAGYVVMRYDSRGSSQTGGAVDSLLLADRAAEVRAALAALGKQKGVDKKRIGVIAFDAGGHGVALAVDQKTPIAGAVLVGPVGLPIDSVLAERIRMTPYAPDDAEAARDALMRLRELLEGTQTWGELSGEKIYLPAMRELLQRDPTDVIGRLKCPTLLVGGGMDWEVPGTGAVRLQETLKARGADNVEIYKADMLDHNLMRLDPGSQLADLADAGRDIDPLTVSVLLAWLGEHVEKKGS